MSRERIITALISFGFLFGVICVDWFGGTHLGSLGLLVLVSALSLRELYRILWRIGLDALPTYGVISLLVLMLARGLLGYTGLSHEAISAYVAILFAMVVIGPVVAGVFREGHGRVGGREEFERVAITMLGLLLVWYLLSFVLELRLLDDGSGTTRLGLELALILVLSVKVGDSTAYLVGRSIGVTPLSWISPKKTWEGAAGSVAGAVVVAVTLGLVFGFSWWKMLLFGLLTNVAGQFGDLLESLLKRRCGVKDSGAFFREAGGFLDLVDSLLLAGPVAYLFVRTVVL